MNNIYTITTVFIGKDFKIDKRTWTYFHHFEDAFNFVENNGWDINENGYWPFVVVESVKQGTLTQKIEYWYQFKDEKYQKISKPTELNGIVSFSMG